MLALQEEQDAGTVVWAKGDDCVVFHDMLAGMDRAKTPSKLVNVEGLGYSAPRKHVHALLELLRFSERGMRTRIGELSGGLQPGSPCAEPSIRTELGQTASPLLL